MSGVGVEELLAARSRAEKAAVAHSAACASVVQPLERLVRLLQENNEGARGNDDDDDDDGKEVVEGGGGADPSRREECERLGESVRAAATSVSRGSSVHAANKDVHAGVSRLSRRLEAIFDVDTERAYRGDLEWWDVRGDGSVRGDRMRNYMHRQVTGRYVPRAEEIRSTRQELLDSVIVHHLLRTGESEVAAAMIDECCNTDKGLERRDAFLETMTIFNEMHKIVEEIDKGELGPVLAWTEQSLRETEAFAGGMGQYGRRSKRRKRHAADDDATTEAGGDNGNADKDRATTGVDASNDNEEDVEDDPDEEGDETRATGENEDDDEIRCDTLAMQAYENTHTHTRKHKQERTFVTPGRSLLSLSEFGKGIKKGGSMSS